MEFDSLARGGAPRQCVSSRNIIGYAAMVVCLFAAYLRAPTIKSDRKTWMECRNDERQCIPTAAAGASSRSSTDTRAKVIETFFLPRSNTEKVIEATAVETYLFPCRLQEFRK